MLNCRQSQGGDMKGFKWLCLGIAFNFLALSIWGLAVFQGYHKLFIIAPFLGSAFFFWAFYFIGKQIKREAAEEAGAKEDARKTKEKLLETQCFSAYEYHRKRQKNHPMIWN
jgi:hypothetical protein